MQNKSLGVGWALLAVAGAALSGALALSVLTVLLFGILAPAAFRDGQFVLVFMLTIPFGALLGGATGLVLRRVRGGDRKRAGWLAISSGIAIFALAMWFVWGSVDSRRGGPTEFLVTLVAPWIAPAWVASVGLLVWGVILLLKNAPSPARSDGPEPPSANGL